jgi:hypothetical protein
LNHWDGHYFVFDRSEVWLLYIILWYLHDVLISDGRVPNHTIPFQKCKYAKVDVHKKGHIKWPIFTL